MSARGTPDWSDSPNPTTTSNDSRQLAEAVSGGIGKLAEDRDKKTAGPPKRIACQICRKRKLRCDGRKPSCGKCSQLGHQCAYDESRKKSGPKRGYVKQLEARLQQVETQLKSKHSSAQPHLDSRVQPSATLNFGTSEVGLPGQLGEQDMPTAFSSEGSGSIKGTPHLANLTLNGTNGAGTPNADFPWDMISLGLEEPLPPPDNVDELHERYFQSIHPTIPMIHKYRYLAALDLPPHKRPPVCLRYAIWALACSVSDKYMSFAELFYRRARKYAEADEMKALGTCMVALGHVQCWVLLSNYEYKMMYYPRAWMSTGRACRLALMCGLNRLDGKGFEVKRTMSPPRDWTEKEERRRSFWMAFCCDRYASIGTGWPMVIDESDIMTDLPSTSEAFESGIPQESISLPDALSADGPAKLSSTAAVAVVACLFGRTLTHLHRVEPDDQPGDTVNGGFWKRQRKLDAVMNNTLRRLPERLRASFGVREPDVLFLNVTMHAAIICVHQAAVRQAEEHGCGDEIIQSSASRAYAAAEEIVTILKLVSHVDSVNMNPFLSFCLFVAARIYTHAHQRLPQDEAIRTNLDFFLNTMQAHRRKNHLTESFLIQLLVELEAAGLPNPLGNSRQPLQPLKRPGDPDYNEDDGSTTFRPLSETQNNFHEPSHNQTARRPSVPILPANFAKISSRPLSHSSFTVPHRDSRPPPPSMPAVHAPVPTQPMLLSHGWAMSDPNAPGNGPGVGTYPIFDTDMSGDHPDQLNSLSGRPTPNDLHRSSSHTSYSTPQDKPVSDAPNAAEAPYYHTGPHYPNFTGAGPKYPSPGATANEFAMTGAWDMAAEPMATGPLGDQQWPPVLTEPVNWTGGLEGWRPLPAASHAGR